MRFLAGAVTLGMCAGIFILGGQGRAGGEATYTGFVWKALYRGYLRDIFTILALVLGWGGLAREQRLGSVPFTLALPISRGRLAIARAAVGVAEVAALAGLVAVIVPLAARMVGRSYALVESSRFAVVWFAGGSAMFAVSFLCSVAFRGEFSAPVASLAALLAYGIVLSIDPISEWKRADIFRLMSGSGMSYFKEATGLIDGPPPWLTALGVLAVAALLILASIRVVNKQDF